MITQVLDVYLHDLFVGKLLQQQGSLSFQYDADYLAQPHAVKLSASLPLSDAIYNHNIVEPFFSGLLPDEIVRRRLARYLGISERNTFALLREIGGECAGAISLYLEGKSPVDNQDNHYRILEDHEAHDILTHLDKRPMLAGEEDIRISGAGAQDKLMISFVDGKMAIPLQNTPSTHIIKPAIRDLDYSVFNELFCMRLAREVGLSVPDTFVHELAGVPYYVVERYDRVIKGGRVTRLHQEDFCQAMHIPPEQKYENEGGPTLAQCFSLLDQKIKMGVMAGKNKIALLQAVIFNFMIGNGDAHGKNFSLLYEGKSESFAPLYDLMCTLTYTNAFKAKMAMKIASKYKFSDVTLRQFEEFATQIGFRPDYVKKQVIELKQRVLSKSISLKEKLNNDLQTACKIYEDIEKIIERNIKQLI